MLQEPAEQLQFLLQITHVYRCIVGDLMRGIWEGNRWLEVTTESSGQHTAQPYV